MAHDGLWEQLVKLDPEETARRARCEYVTSPAATFIMTFLNRQYAVDPAHKTVLLTMEGDQDEAGFLEQLCILAYLINAQDKPLSNELVGEKSLPGGDFYFRAKPHVLPTHKLVGAFGHCPEKLYDVMGEFDGERCDFGDASIQLFVLPRIPLTAVVWAADDEFEARAAVRFDKTATDHLPLDALGAAASVAINALVNAAASAE